MSLGTRALVAVVLTVAFYVLAVGVALGLVVGVLVLEVNVGFGSIWLTAAALGAGFTILRGIIPPRSAFKPSGPELTRTEQPELHGLLDQVAREAGETPADHVYLDLDVNAGVRQRRRHRELELGLPLLAMLDTDELRAIVAHEYGHYQSGDTRFGAWIWRTRGVVLKTVHVLSERPSIFWRILRVPFVLYAKLFLRITNAISRRAEFVADQLGASVVGPETMGRALRRLVAVSPAYDSYWNSDVVPMLEARCRPPLSAGFVAMTAHAGLAAKLDGFVRTDVDSRERNPYDSHPTLRQRLQALGVAVDGAAPPAVPTPATSLLRDLPAVERDLLSYRFGDEVGGFQIAHWTDAGTVQVARFRAFVESYRQALPFNLRLMDAAGLVATPPRSLLSAVHQRSRGMADENQVRRTVLDVVAGMVVTAAAKAGASVTAMPGEPVTITLDRAGSLAPWLALQPALEGEAGLSDWAVEPVVLALRDRLI